MNEVFVEFSTSIPYIPIIVLTDEISKFNVKYKNSSKKKSLMIIFFINKIKIQLFKGYNENCD